MWRPNSANLVGYPLPAQEEEPMTPGHPNGALAALMLEAYRPCPNFGVCREAKWDPARGQVPRGFIGATASPSDVELVMVFSEPGHPHHDEGHDPGLDGPGMMASAVRHVYGCYRGRTDTFHVNVRRFMSMVYPELSFDEQLRHVWLTEGRLCSIEDEIGDARDGTCSRHYLARQLALLPDATVVAFGKKAQRYLTRLRIGFVAAVALAPPGANHRGALPSWEAAAAEVRARRRAPAALQP